MPSDLRCVVFLAVAAVVHANEDDTSWWPKVSAMESRPAADGMNSALEQWSQRRAEEGDQRLREMYRLCLEIALLTVVVICVLWVKKGCCTSGCPAADEESVPCSASSKSLNRRSSSCRTVRHTEGGTSNVEKGCEASMTV